MGVKPTKKIYCKKIKIILDKHFELPNKGAMQKYFKGYVMVKKRAKELAKGRWGKEGTRLLVGWSRECCL